MIKIKTLIFNPFQENTYLLFDETNECVIVDAGCYTAQEFDQLVTFIEKNDLRPMKLVNTHCHVDHVLGIARMMDKYKIPFEAHRNEDNIIGEAVLHGKVFGFQLEQPPFPTGYLKEGDEVKVGNSALKVLEVPGHSQGSIALYSSEGEFVITGDALFRGSIGRTDLTGGDYNQLMNSIYKKLLVLDRSTKVYPGHGPSSTIGEEIMTNPFLSPLGV
ncbi:MAG TPA: MBL fold metallo-hydrolase [Bacteroidales bacterium]|nr:MBL fold metallo-hydrolase [Bacteroidales bacterium]